MTPPNTQPRTKKAMQNLPQQAREAAAWVASQAEHIAIRHDRIEDYAADLLSRYDIITALDAETHFISEASPAATAAFVLALDSVNFGSGYFYLAKQEGVELEYETVAAGLKTAFLVGRMNTPEKWGRATAEECHDIFAIPAGLNPALDRLMALFAEHLQDSGRMVVSQCGGDVLELLAASKGSAARLAGIVAGWTGFEDKAVYKGREIPFYKRAQILAADMHLAFHGKPPAAFADLDALTNFPDNMVPHVLRCDGILEYSPALAAAIDAGRMLEAGSDEETELRAHGIHAVELLKEAALRQGREVTSMNIDHILWNRGYEPDIYARPSHRTMTDCY
ncbi:MAG: hypothetical protein GC185_02110 [Alphaproteobacteria bacterium]|nr:hypothetical protein [Alphaproteobacteria bacterium]